MVADSFDAMTTSTTYKSRTSHAQAIEQLKKFSTILYDTNVLDVAIGILKLIHIDEHINQDPISDIDNERFPYFFKDPLIHVCLHGSGQLFDIGVR